MAAKIHPTAIVHESARLGEDVEIGPYCVVGADVSIGDGTRLISHVRVCGRTSIGAQNVIHSFSVIGSEPQDVSDAGEGTELVIGDRNVIREFVTINRGTRKGGGRTVVGSDNYVMACGHVAHDCVIGNRVTLVNGAILGGHVEVQDYAYVSGHVAVHQFTTIGRYAFISGATRINRDAPPFMLVHGNDPIVVGVNGTGLRRHGFRAEVIEALKEAHRILWGSGLPLPDAIEILRRTFNGQFADIEYLIEFLLNTTRGRNGRAREALRTGAAPARSPAV